MHVGLTYDLRKGYLSKGFSAEQVAEFDCKETISVTSEPEKGCIFAFTLKAYSKDGKYKGGDS